MFHPRVASRFVGTFSLILNTKFSGEDLQAELEAFEKTIRRYEQESSKSIDDEMLMGIIINGIQDNSILRPRHQECFKVGLSKCEGRTVRDVSRQPGAGANAQPDGNRSRAAERQKR